ncbi:MAG: ABC transporter permease [Traorella sp.]
MNLINQIFPLALMSAMPLVLGALSGFYSERSGIINIAIDATMQIGAFVACTTMIVCEWVGMNSFMIPWVALVMAILFGILFIALHALASIHFYADQTISSTALNVFASGLTIYLCQIFFNGKKQSDYFALSSSFTKLDIPFLKDIPIIGPLFFQNAYLTTYLTILLVFVTWFIIYKTTFGLRMRSCGEHPLASASMGVNVIKTRWISMLISGALGGLAGAVLIMTTSSYYYGGTVHGLGFVAIATLIFGRWNPWGCLFAGVFFGFAQILGYFSSSIFFLAGLPVEFYSMFPYLVTIIVLIIFSGKNHAPASCGEIYDIHKR